MKRYRRNGVFRMSDRTFFSMGFVNDGVAYSLLRVKTAKVSVVLSPSYGELFTLHLLVQSKFS